MRLFIAGVATESNTFAPMPTGLDDYTIFRGAPPEDRPTSFTQPFLVWRRLAAERGITAVGSLGASAPPAGPTVRRVWEDFRDEILQDLRRAMPVDGVLLNLHGAMVADGYDDCEGDILARVRAIVGPSVPTGAELDPHCHVTPLMVEQATALVLYKEFPHTDFAARAEDLFRLIVDAAESRTRPHMALWDCRMLGSYFTTLQPMKGFVDDVKALEGRDGVLSISPVHGFPYGDVALLNSNWSYRNASYVVAQNTGAFLEIPSLLDEQHTVTSAPDAEAYLARLEAYAGQIDGETERLKSAAAQMSTPGRGADHE